MLVMQHLFSLIPPSLLIRFLTPVSCTEPLGSPSPHLFHANPGKERHNKHNTEESRELNEVHPHNMQRNTA